MISDRQLLRRFALPFVFALTLQGQQTTGSLAGVVVDSSGGAVVGASVKLRDRATGNQRELSSSAQGEFLFAALPPATYTVEISAHGFKRTIRDNVSLPPNERLSLGTLQLELGQVTEAVTVSAQGAAVQVESSERSGLISSAQISDLAVVNRNFTSLAAQMPGVAAGLVADSTGFSSTIGLNVQGGRQTGNNIMIDGLPVNDMGGGAQPVDFVSMDSVQQVKVLVSNFQAEFGRKPGASIQAVTKSGTTEFHGAAFWYQRNEVLNANNFFNNRQNVTKPRYRYITAGANIGGPIPLPGRLKKNKLFFFFNAEILTEQRPGNIQSLTMPTIAERLGDFSDSRNVNNALIVINDPTTGKPFPNNAIPTSRISPQGQGFLKLLPLPNYFDRVISRNNFNFQFQESLDVPKHNEITRVDYNITQKIMWYARFNNWWEEARGAAVPAGSSPWGWLPSKYQDTNRSGTVNGLFLLNPSTVLEISSGYMYGQEANPLDPKSSDRVSRSKTGVNLPQLYPQYNPMNLLPQATFAGRTGTPTITYDARFPITGLSRLWTWNGALSKTMLSHSLKTGVWVEYAMDNRGASGNFAGTYGFNRDVNNSLDSNDPYSNAMLGVFSSYTESTTRPAVRARSSIVEWYAQDTWKVSRRLTLDIGVRFGVAQPYTNKDRQSAGFVPSMWDPAQVVKLIQPVGTGTQRVGRNPNTGATLPAAFIGGIAEGAGNLTNGTVYAAVNTSYPASLRDSSGLRTAPRIGFAYDPTGSGKTAIRGGFGIFYEMREMGLRQFNTYLNPPIQLNPTIYYGTVDTLLNSRGANFPSATTGFDRSWPVASNLNFNLGVQRNIGLGTVVDVSYAAALGRHLQQGSNLNAIPAGANFETRNQDPTTPGRPYAAAFLRPYPGYNNISYYSYSGNSSYHSLQTTVNRRFAKGAQYGAAWTWSKAMNYTDTNTALVSSVVDPRVWDYGKAGYDRTHILKANFTYEIPSLTLLGNHAIAKGVFQGWQVSGIATIQSGVPLGITAGFVNAVDITGSPTDGPRAVMLQNPILPKSERTFDRNFNTAAFGPPSVGSFGNAPKDVVRGPGLNNWDLTMMKNFRLSGEKLKLQLRGELYNAFNHTQFTTWNTAASFDALGKQSNALFGQATGAAPSRRIQIALRLTY